ncbi:MAG: hypothetical protein ABL928_09645 [Sphingorhabdus sp.]
MIDAKWLEALFCVGGGNRNGKELDQLGQELGEQSEVLPYLLLTAGSFVGWPAARTALHTAARSVIRPSHMRVARSPGTLGGATLRRDLRASLITVLTDSQSESHDPDSEGTDVRVRAADSIARFRSATGGPDPEPHSFIPIK